MQTIQYMRNQMHLYATVAAMFVLGSADAGNPQPNLVFVLVVRAHLAVSQLRGNAITNIVLLCCHTWGHRMILAGTEWVTTTQK